MKKRLVILLMTALMGTVFAGCGSKSDATRESEESEKTEKEGIGEEDTQEETVLQRIVGISMPGDGGESDSLTADAVEMHLQLEQNGYNSQVSYADSDTEQQKAQIQTMIDAEVAALIIDPVDPFALGEVLQNAEDAGIPVFSYDKLIMNSNAVNYYITYHTRKIGQITARTIIEQMNLDVQEETDNTSEETEVDASQAETSSSTQIEENQTENSALAEVNFWRKHAAPYTIEFMMGEPDQLNDLYFYNGVMEVLQPYFENGTLICLSGQISFDETATRNRSSIVAAKRLQRILKDSYQETDLDFLITAEDGFAIQAAELLSKAGYSVENGTFAGITAYGCSSDAVRRIISGEILSGVYMDRRALADKCIETVAAYLSGEKPDVDNYEQYDNGVKIIRTMLADPLYIDSSTYQILLEEGYYTQQQLSISPVPEEEISEDSESETEDTEEVEDVNEKKDE